MPWTRPRTPLHLAALCLLTSACGDSSSGREGEAECVSAFLPGDLVISELMINPAGDDTGKEWIELYNPSDDEIDLSGALLRFMRSDGSGERIHQIQALTVGGKDYVVLGNVDPESLPAHVDYGYAGDLGQGLSSRDGIVTVGCGTSFVDEVRYVFDEELDELPSPPPDNVSWIYDGIRTPDALGNDELSAWCESNTVFEPGNDGSNGLPVTPDAVGTPGARNDACLVSNPNVCEENGIERAIVPPGPGDLVVTEVMPNPDAERPGVVDEDGEPVSVEDDDGEWFEVYVKANVDLNGLTFTRNGEDEPADILNTVACIPATAGSYLVFAPNADTEVNGGLDVDHLITMSLSNAEGANGNAGFSMRWGDTELDKVEWKGSKAGVSEQLDSDYFEPFRIVADDGVTSCDATTPYGLGDLGTPGEPNEICVFEPVEGQCRDTPDARELRPIRAPELGDLWITEFMADSDAVSNTDGEWFEVQANAAFDLNALEFGREDDKEDDDVEETVELLDCVPVEAGDVLLFARNADSSLNGGLPEADYEVPLALINSEGRLFVGANGELLDAVTWTDITGGASRALDPSITGPDANDDEANWCDGSSPYGDGDLGTPGTENPTCGNTPPGTCDDGGTPREPVAPTAGDLVITEWMADPSAVTDTNGEWFEVLVNADVDLNGLQIGDDPEDPNTTLPATGPCISATAGTRVVFARNADSTTNGGIAGAIEASFTLSNTADSLFVGHGGIVLDEISYTDSEAGASTAVVPGSEDPSANDDEANHCVSGTVYGDGDNGTPGAANVCE